MTLTPEEEIKDFFSPNNPLVRKGLKIATTAAGFPGCPKYLAIIPVVTDDGKIDGLMVGINLKSSLPRLEREMAIAVLKTVLAIAADEKYQISPYLKNMMLEAIQALGEMNYRIVEK